MSSCLGSVGVSPYTEDDAAYTMRLTLASRAATSRFTVASTFARLLLRGSSTDLAPMESPLGGERNPLRCRPTPPLSCRASPLHENRCGLEFPRCSPFFRWKDCQFRVPGLPAPAQRAPAPIQ